MNITFIDDQTLTNGIEAYSTKYRVLHLRELSEPLLLDEPTSEHYIQAQKFASTVHEEEIRLARTPNSEGIPENCKKMKELNWSIETVWLFCCLGIVKRKSQARSSILPIN
ncbi:hypothetical protein [Bacillus sp. FJAT-28004]|uniref:hypothetical protein n=1 Tax=Bacillus sp. FJAT-28004 TaxID=1679165 RepID=UPI0006B47C26|nr:hypothetical protein [Bacillus sp. FJAT-28004]